MDDIVMFNECSLDDAKIIGKKAAYISELYSKGFNVLNGLVITGNLFVKFIEMTQLKERVAEILVNNDDIEKKSLQIQQMILNTPFPEDMAKFIYNAYLKLDEHEMPQEPYIALRVSSTSDYVEDAFFLNIKGKDRFINGIKSCWASVFTPKNLPLKRFKPSIIVQVMASPIKSGYVYSQNPINGKSDEVLVQICTGLGNGLTLGQVTPSTYIIDKETQNVKSSLLKEQNVEYRLSMEKERTERHEMEESVRNILDEYLIKELASLASKIETRINEPQRLTFAIEKQIRIIGTQAIDEDKFQASFAPLYAQEPTKTGQEHSREEEVEKQLDEEHATPYSINSETDEKQYEQKQEQIHYQHPQFQESQAQTDQENDVEHDASRQNYESITDEQDTANINEMNNSNNEAEDEMLKYYQPELHYQKDQEYTQKDTSEEDTQKNKNSDTPDKKKNPQISKDEFVSQFMPKKPELLFSKVLFNGSMICIGCDLAITAAMKNKYQSLYFKEPPINRDQIINELKLKVNVPFEKEIIIIRKLRDTFLNDIRELTYVEIQSCLDYTKKFLDQF